MSQVASPGKPLSQTPPNGGSDVALANRDSLRAYVEQAARNMRRTEFFYGLLWWLTVVVFIVTSAVLVDHWLWPLNKVARFAVLGGLVLWTCWWIPRRLMPPMMHPIHIEHAARSIEKQFPDCKDSLISWLQLSRDDAKTPKGVVSYLGRYAVRNLNGQDAQSVVDSATVVRLAAAFFGCLLCSSIYMFSSPKNGAVSIARLMMPWANIAPAARVQFLEILPGNTTVTQGSMLPLSVTIRGMHQGDKVSVRFDLSDSQLVGQFVPMIPEIERISYKLDLGKTFGGIHQPLKYWIYAGDAVEGPFDVKVQVVPLVAVERTELTYPPYTKLKPRTLLQNGSFEAPEGTRVELHASANQRMKTARLEFDPVVEQSVFQTARELVTMEILDQQIKGRWIALLDEKQSNPTTTSYRIYATNHFDESNADPVLYQAKVVKDLPPEVSIDTDLSGILEIPVSGAVELELRANDPDYGLTAMYAFGAESSKKQGTSKPRTELFRETIFESEEGTLGQVSRTWKLTPSKYEWKPGSEFDLFVEAFDNRHDPKSQQAQPNRSLSTPVRVRIVEDRKPDTDDQPQPQTEDQAKQEAKGTKPRTKWELTPDKKESGSSKEANSSNTQPQEQQSKNSNPENASNGGRGAGESSTNNSQNSDGQGNEKGQGKGPGKTQGQNSGEGQSSGSADNMNSESTSSSTRAVSGKPSQSNPSQENVKPPSHDGEAIERINQFRQEQEKQNDRQADKPMSEDSPQNESGTEQRNKPSNMNRSTREGEQGQGTATGEEGTSNDAAGKEGAGKEGAGKEGAGKEGTGKEGTGKEGAGKEGAGKEGNGKEGTGKEGTGKEGTGKEGTGKEGTGKEGTGKEGAGKEGAGKEGAGKEGTGKEGAGKEGAGKEGAGKEGTGKEGAGKEGAGKEGTGKEGTGKEGTGKEGTGKEGTGKEGTGKEGAGKEGTGKEGTGKEGTGKEGAGKEGTGKEGTGKEGAGKEGTGKEGTGKEGAGKEGTGKEGTGKEGTGKEGAGKEDAGKEGTGKEGAGKEGAGKKGDKGKSNGSQDPGAGGGSEADAGNGDGSGDSSDASSKGSGGGSPGAGVNRGGKTPDGGGGAKGSGGVTKTNGPEKANLEYAEKTTDMVLDYLDRQRDQPDPELLKRMGWTAEDLRKFADRWNSAREQSRLTPEKRAEFEAALRSLGLRHADRRPTRLEDRDDQLQGMQEEGVRLRPPETLREQFEAFRKAAGKLNKSP